MSKFTQTDIGQPVDLDVESLESKGDIVTPSDIYCNTINALYFNIGGLSITGSLYAPDGTASLPAYSFTNSTNSGLYLLTTPYTSVNFSISSNRKMEIADTATWMYSDFLPNNNNLFKLGQTGQIWSEVHAAKYVNAFGSTAAPSFTFSGRSDLGIYSSAVNTLDFTTLGTTRLTLNTAAITSTLPLDLPNGTVGAPSLYFGSTTTGLYQTATNQIGFSIAGQNRLNISATNVQLGSTPLEIIHAGTTSLVSLNFNGDPNTGFNGNGSDNIDVVVGGAVRMAFSKSAITNTLPLLGPNASAAAPTYSFSNDPDTGMYGDGSNNTIFASAASTSLTIGGAAITVGAARQILTPLGGVSGPSLV